MAAITISGGDKWKAYLERLAQKAEVRAGVLEGATNIETRQLVAEYAAYNEFGTARIPARPFMRTTLQKQRGEWVQGLGRLLASRDPEQALHFVGRRMEDDIRAKILSNMAPANAPSTVARKNKEEAGRAGTLVDTGALAQSISYEISK